VQTLIEGRGAYAEPPWRFSRPLLPALLLGLALSNAGCGQPSEREYKNRRELEAVLTAVSLKNPKELEKDARRLENRHAAGELSDASHQELMKIVATARAGDWASAERLAYEFRESNPFFK
jgi:hypothetical protein